MTFSFMSQRSGAKSFPSKVERRPKLQNGKNGTRMTEEKLQQAQMFLSDDVPSTSCSMTQDILQAKQSRVLFSSTPLSRAGQGLPSGFTVSMTKRVKVDRTLMAAMASERPWVCPDKFVPDPSWLVAEGGESTEVVSQQQREGMVFKAVYTCPSSIPFSPMEPEEKCKDVDDSMVPYIPLLSMEDEESLQEDCSRYSSMSGAQGATYSYSCQLEQPKISSSCQQPDTNSIKKSVLHEIACTDISKNGQGLLSLNNADLKIAAAAAATYAAVKPLEGSSNIDQELLFQILSSPVFLNSLFSSKKNPKTNIQESPKAVFNKVLTTENHISNESSSMSRSLLPAFWRCPMPVTHASKNVWHHGPEKI